MKNIYAKEFLVTMLIVFSNVVSVAGEESYSESAIDHRMQNADREAEQDQQQQQIERQQEEIEQQRTKIQKIIKEQNSVSPPWQDYSLMPATPSRGQEADKLADDVIKKAEEERRVRYPLAEPIDAYQRKDYDVALRLFYPLAAHGDPTAQIYMGNIYNYGLGVPEDHEEAVRWYKKASKY